MLKFEKRIESTHNIHEIDRSYSIELKILQMFNKWHVKDQSELVALITAIKNNQQKILYITGDRKKMWRGQTIDSI